jgi:Ca2+-binding RTX toxin-like protein
MSAEFVALKSSFAAVGTTMAVIGGGALIGLSLGAGVLALPVAMVGFGFVYFSQQVGAAVAEFTDWLADHAIAEFGSWAEDLILQSEFIWGTEDDNTLIAMNPNIVQHLHGVDGENTLIGSDGRNFFYGGPQKDIIQTGEGDNVVFGDPVPNLSQLHFMRGGDNEITTGDGDNQIFTYKGNSTIRLGDGDNVVYSGLGSDHIHVGAGNNIIDAETIWVGQVHHHAAGAIDDRNIIDYSALNRSLVVKASVNEPVTGCRSFTVDKIDPDGGGHPAGMGEDVLRSCARDVSAGDYAGELREAA